MEKTKLVIVDDSKEYRDVLKMFLCLDNDLKVLKTFENASQILEFSQKNEIHSIVIDYRLISDDLEEIVNTIKRNHPKINIVLYSVEHSILQKNYFQQQFGINHFFSKFDMTFNELIIALKDHNFYTEFK